MKTIKYTLLVLIATGCGILTSCSNDDNEKYEPLSVTKVSTVLDREEGINTAELAQYIIVQGTGLNATNAIQVNDIEVDLKTAYITKNEIVFPVPRVVPLEVTNLLTVKTPSASATASITINVPPIQVDGMYNEFAPAGTIGKVVGNNFDLYEITTESGQLFFGDKEVEITEATATTLSFTIPANAQAGTKLKVVSPVNGETLVPGKYAERYNMLCDFDPYTGWGGGHYVSNGPTPEPTSGNYSHFKLAEGDADDWAWNDETSIIMVNIDYFPEVLANPENYLFKFETCTLTPLIRRQIRCYFSQFEYAWEPFASGLPFSTNGEWRTISLDLKEVWGDQIPNDGVIQILGNSWAEDTDICFDNFRIVPKN